MNMNTRDLFRRIRKAGLATMVLLLSLFSQAQVHNTNLPGGTPNDTLKYFFPINKPIAAGAANIQVQTASAQVIWNYGATPSPPVGRVLNHLGLTITLPADPNAPVSSAQPVTITGTPNATGSFNLILTVADAVNPGTLQAQDTFEIFITEPLDVVLVLDRSGSMVLEASPGVSRWNALKNAALMLANSYKDLAGTDHQVRIVYFESSPTPVSGCCDAPKVVTNNLPTEFNTDFVGKDPNFGATAMGAAIKAAQGKLIPVTPGKKPAIFFFTDGEQNPAQILVNGQGFTDNPTGIPAPGNPNHIRMHTIGFEGTNPQSDLLNNMASHTQGSYHHSATGNDLGDAFTDALTNLMNGSSPQLVARSSHTVPANNTPVTLETFPLNNFVNKLLLTFEFGKTFERPQLLQALYRIKVMKDGVNMLSYATPSFPSNYTNTMLLTFDFVNPPYERPSINPAGQWTVSISDSTLKFNTAKLTVLADDHRFHIKRTLANKTPKVNEAFPISVKLDWMSVPVKNMTVEALIFQPGADIGNALAINPFKVDVSKAVDAGSPGRQKFDKLFATDSAFRNLFNRTENKVSLTHKGDGVYEGTFNGLTVSGTYKLIIRINGTDSVGGKIQRIVSESFFTNFAGVDMPASKITTVIQRGQLVMNITPITSYKMLIGPGMGITFGVSNPAIKIDSVADHQDGSYTVTFSGAINDTTSLSVGGQVIHQGKLQDAGKGGSIWDKLGIPAWLFWLILIALLILILWLIFRKKN
jgi:hypothetical protein